MRDGKPVPPSCSRGLTPLRLCCSPWAAALSWACRASVAPQGAAFISSAHVASVSTVSQLGRLAALRLHAGLGGDAPALLSPRRPLAVPRALRRGGRRQSRD